MVSPISPVPRTVLLTILLFLAFPSAPAARAEAPTTLPPAMEQALEVLRASRPAAGKDRLEAARAGLRTVARERLDDDTWLDLHLLGLELDRRLSPRPKPGKTASHVAFTPTSVPRNLTGTEPTDPLALLDLAGRVMEIGFAPGSAPPGPEERIALAEGAARARRLMRTAAAIESDDPVLRAAAELLAESARDLAFDLDVRANGQVPEGRAGFEWLLTRRHRLSLTPEEALRIGWGAVTECLSRLQEAAQATAPGRTWQEQVAAHQADHPQDEEELLAYCQAVTSAAELAARDSGIITIPEFAGRPRVLLGTPSFPAPYAWYLPGGEPFEGRFGGRVMYSEFEEGVPAGRIESLLRDRSRSWLKVICPHEAVPGHHLQFAVASRVARPCRGYGYSSTYVEGWGLYTEELMDRIGFYQGPAEHMAYLRMKLWRAVRVVVDAELHAGRMKPSEAVRMLTDYVLLERSAAEAEVRRYMTMPTQPLSYLIGYRKIRALRDAYLVRYGRDREREFHDRFLALGPVPLDLAAAVLLGKRAAYDAAH